MTDKDRESFIKNISCENFRETIVRYFDQTMALYNLVGEYKNIQIRGDVDNSNIEFVLEFKSLFDAGTAFDILDNSKVTVFDKDYSVKVLRENHSPTLLHVRLI